MSDLPWTKWTEAWPDWQDKGRMVDVKKDDVAIRGRLDFEEVFSDGADEFPLWILAVNDMKASFMDCDEWRFVDDPPPPKRPEWWLQLASLRSALAAGYSPARIRHLGSKAAAPFDLSGISDERLNELNIALAGMRRASDNFPNATMRIQLEISALWDACAIEFWRREDAKITW